MTHTAIIVEDDHKVAEQISRMLGKLNVDASICHSSREVMLKVQQTRPNFMTVSINLKAGVDGVEVMRYMRREPLTSGIPMIVITSETRPLELQRAQLAGAKIFVSKPVQFDKLAAAVEEAIEMTHY